MIREVNLMLMECFYCWLIPGEMIRSLRIRLQRLSSSSHPFLFESKWRVKRQKKKEKENETKSFGDNWADKEISKISDIWLRYGRKEYQSADGRKIMISLWVSKTSRWIDWFHLGQSSPRSAQSLIIWLMATVFSLQTSPDELPTQQPLVCSYVSLLTAHKHT